MMIMSTVIVVMNTGARKDFRERTYLGRIKSRSSLPPAKRHLRLNLDTKWKQKSLPHKVKKKSRQQKAQPWSLLRWRGGFVASVAMTNGSDFKPFQASTNSCDLLQLKSPVSSSTWWSPSWWWSPRWRSSGWRQWKWISTREAKSTAAALSSKISVTSIWSIHDGHDEAFDRDNCNQGGDDNHKKATKKVNSIIAFLPRERVSRNCGVKFEKCSFPIFSFLQTLF